MATTTLTTTGKGFAGGYLVGILASLLLLSSSSPSPSSSSPLAAPLPPATTPGPMATAPTAVWYSTTHRHYQVILKHTEYASNATATANTNANANAAAGGIDAHAVAETFCRKTGMGLQNLLPWRAWSRAIWRRPAIRGRP